jgi:hypothetical protein
MIESITWVNVHVTISLIKNIILYVSNNALQFNRRESQFSNLYFAGKRIATTTAVT